MKITNKQISNYFKSAKSNLCDGSNGEFSRDLSYICNAISDVRYTHKGFDIGCHDTICKNIIMSRFPERKNKAFPHSVGTYLREVVKVPRSQLTHKNVQKFRHRWLDSLIEEFNVPGYYEG